MSKCCTGALDAIHSFQFIASSQHTHTNYTYVIVKWNSKRWKGWVYGRKNVVHQNKFSCIVDEIESKTAVACNTLLLLWLLLLLLVLLHWLFVVLFNICSYTRTHTRKKKQTKKERKHIVHIDFVSIFLLIVDESSVCV